MLSPKSFNFAKDCSKSHLILYCGPI